MAGSDVRAGRVLSVQSHVVRGHCGNKVGYPARPQLSLSRPPLAPPPHPRGQLARSEASSHEFELLAGAGGAASGVF